MKNVLILDAYNMIHRCRFNWGGGNAEGEYKIVYNFMKLIRATLEEYASDDVYFVVDGKPKRRIDKFSEYKANRKKDLTNPEEAAYWENFSRQKKIIVSMVKKYFPINVAYHPNEEADDVVYHICKYKCSKEDNITIISSDSDYIQIINEMDNVRLFNPIARKFRGKTEYDYVAWKAMVGDRSDNISGVPRIGKVNATKILKNGTLDERLKDDTFKKTFELCYYLIKLSDLADDVDNIEFTKAEFEFDVLKSQFELMDFQSMLGDKYLEKYKETFEAIV